MRGRFEVRVRGSALIGMAFWVMLVPLGWIAGAAAAAGVHELGHLIVLWMLDVPVYGIELGLSGAVIRTGPLEQREELWSALAGPMAGAMVCLFWRWCPEAAVCAAVQTLFNLMPLYPLDGGRLWLAMRNICCKSEQKRVQ